MNFEDFRKDFESKLSQFTSFELQEYNYAPHFMGSGFLVYRMKGRIFKFFYDGRENEITCESSDKHSKYDGSCKFSEIDRLHGLEHSGDTYKNIINAK